MKTYKLLTTLLCVFFTLNTFSQYLSKSKSYITSILKEQKVKFIEIDEFISVSKINNCNYLFEFNKNNICISETIIALDNPQIVSLIMDLNNKYYIRLNDTFFHEEPYGLVQVKNKNNIFVYTYE